MNKIKVVSNPYEKIVTFSRYDLSSESWITINSENNSNSKLVSAVFQRGFFPFKVYDILKEIDSSADKNTEKLNVLKQTTPQEILSMDDVSGRLDYSIQIAKLQKQLAQAVRTRDTEGFNESYNEIITLEQRIKRLESYSYRYLSDKISDVKGEPRTKL